MKISNYKILIPVICIVVAITTAVVFTNHVAKISHSPVTEIINPF